MANYSPNAKSLLYGLSDFWNELFREHAQLSEIYRGMEVEVGQAYLDLLALLLNNSIQDTTLFNTDYFKLLRLREDTITYASDQGFVLPLDTNIAGLKFMHDRVFEPTQALERNIDFRFDEAARSVRFNYDPFNAYYACTFGDVTDAFKVTTVQPGAPEPQLRVTLVDNGVNPPTLQRVNDAAETEIVIEYDGPSNTATTPATALVSLLNTHLETTGFIIANITGNGSGANSPAGATKLLQRQASAPLRGFATRSFDVLFGTRFHFDGISNWLDTRVQKGDVLRIMPSSLIATTQEFPIALVREDALYLYPQISPVDVPGSLAFTILRSPADDLSESEPGPASGVLASIPAADVDPSLQRITSVGAGFTRFDVGQLIILSGVANAGAWTILEWVDSDTVAVGGAALEIELGVTAELRTTHTQQGTAGEFANGSPGTAYFYDPALTTVDDITGRYIRVDRTGLGDFVTFPILARTGSNEYKISVPEGIPNGTGIAWAYESERPAEASLAHYLYTLGLPVPGTVTVDARRFTGEPVIEGIDYLIDYDIGFIRPLTVWQPRTVNPLSYRWREVILSTFLYGPAATNAGDGTLLDTVPLRYTSPTWSTAAIRPGDVLLIENSNSANRGEFVVANVINDNVVEFAPRTGDVLDGDNGSFSASVNRRGRAEVTDVIEPVTEIGAWVPDAKIDEFHLYFTYGYLLNRISTSTENYRALIRGVFQLFMLGPTLERFEAAINAVAGLSTIRDDGEILLAYQDEALTAGGDGVFDSNAYTFSDVTATFSPSSINTQLYVVSGFNANRLFTITEFIDANTVRVAETPTTDSGVLWETTGTGTHSIVTTRATYTYPRTAPLKPKFTNMLNMGVLELRAFEVVTAVFTVTDYVETPKWWEYARIPAELAPNMSPQRRQITPALTENVFDPSDGACFNDPGLFFNADDSGVVIEPVELVDGSNGDLYPDPLYPVRNTEVYFDSFDLVSYPDNVVGHYLETEIDGIEYRFRILERTAPDRVKLENFASLPVDVSTNLDWRITTGTLAMRHSAAYVILDGELKYHLFNVRFDAFLFSSLAADTLRDLQELVFVAKPSYTYLLLTPASLFDDVFQLREDELSASARYQLGGSGGSVIEPSSPELTYDGSWTFGSWYRYASNSGTFAAPASSVPDVLGTPDPDHDLRIHAFYIDPPTFTSNGRPDPFFTFVDKPGFSSSATVSASGDIMQVTTALAAFQPGMEGFRFTLSGSGAANDGSFYIGKVISSNTIQFYNPTATTEGGLFFALYAQGSSNGAVTRDAYGQTVFERLSANGSTFNSGDVGTYIRRPFVTARMEQSYEILERLHALRVRVGKRLRYPGLAFDVTIAGDGVGVSVDVPGEWIFFEEQCYLNRFAANPATSLQDITYLEFLSGPNTGDRIRLDRYLSPTTALLEASGLTPGAAQSVTVVIDQHLRGELDPGGRWEQLRRSVYIDPAATNTMRIDEGGSDASIASYTAFGVMVPTDPAVATFSATLGDTYYAFNGINPAPPHLGVRTGRDMDLREHPIMISVTGES